MSKRKLWMLSIFMIIILFPKTASAMHIIEGFLPPKWSIFWGVLTIPFILIGLLSIQKTSKENPRIKILLAMAGAFAFVLSALKLPSVTGSCSHPTGVGLGAILFGPTTMSVLGLIVLIFQAVLLGHGGLTSLGANTFAMAVVGPIVAFATYKIVKKANGSRRLAVFFAGFLGDLLTYVTTSVQLALAFPSEVGGFIASLEKFMGIFALTQIPIAISEGILTVIIFNALECYGKEELKSLKIFFGGVKDIEAKAVVEEVILKENKTQEAIIKCTNNFGYKKILILIALVIGLAVIPLFIAKNAEFNGADGQAKAAINEIDKDYKPWFSPIFEPPSAEIESLLFALQASIGAGILGYGIGFLHGKSKKRDGKRTC